MTSTGARASKTSRIRSPVKSLIVGVARSQSDPPGRTLTSQNAPDACHRRGPAQARGQLGGHDGDPGVPAQHGPRIGYPGDGVERGALQRRFRRPERHHPAGRRVGPIPPAP